MLKNTLIFSITLMLIVSCTATEESKSSAEKNSVPTDTTTISVAFADYILENWKDPNTLSQKGWEYNNTIILHGIEKVYNKTGDEKYLNYIKDFVDQYVNEAGEIRDLEPEANNLDKLHPGIILFPLIEKYGDKKYQLAADKIRAEFDNQPRTQEGGFWHKQKYETEMWLDGIYMAEPFLVRYGALSGEGEDEFTEAVTQVSLIAEKTYNPETQLFYHGWDSNKNASWADPVTGQSSYYWSRGLGWFAMAMVDILEFLPEDHPKREVFINTLDSIVSGIQRYQDDETGLWYQVLDKGNDSENWIEVSGSAMFIYSIKKGVRLGVIDEKHLSIAENGWEGLKKKVKVKNGHPVIFDVVEGMGIQDTYDGYINKERLENSTHGLCAILMAASEMEY